jgi:hypothetical protein
MDIPPNCGFSFDSLQDNLSEKSSGLPKPHLFINLFDTLNLALIEFALKWKTFYIIRLELKNQQVPLKVP